MGVDLDLYVLSKDGTELPVEISLSPIRDGDRLLVAAALRDVTDRKRIQTELMQAREAAERANLAKSRFLATASHGLRQPLQTLSLLNGTLRRVIHDPIAGEAVAQQGHLIVVGRRARPDESGAGTFGSVARHIAVLAPMDALVVPSESVTPTARRRVAIESTKSSSLQNGPGARCAPIYDKVDRRLMDAFPASDAVAQC